MPKTNTPPHRVPVYRRPIILAGAVIAIIIIAALTVLILNLVRHSSSDTDPKPPSASSSSESNSPLVGPTGPSSDQPSTPETPAEKDILQYEGGDPNAADELSGYITYKSVDDDVLTIVASISQYLQSDGSCTLTLYNYGEAAASSTLVATPDVTSSVCGPFEIPLSELDSGSYIIDITLSGDDKTGHISDEVDI